MIKIKIGKNTVEYSLIEFIIGILAILGALLTLIGIIVKNIGSDDQESTPTPIEKTIQTEPESNW